MKKRGWIRYSLLIAVFIVMLCGCNSNSQKEEQSVQPDGTLVTGTQAAVTDSPEVTDLPMVTDSPEVTASPEITDSPVATDAPPITDTPAEPSISDLYEKTANDRVYKLNTINTEGYGIEQAYLKDGYVLVVMRDYSEQGYVSESGIAHLLNSGKLVLFPLKNPAAAVELKVDSFSGRYTLLENGSVLKTDWEGSYTIYNSKLEELYKETANCGKFLGASMQGDLWFLTSDSSFVLYRDGEKVQNISAEGMINGSYIGTDNGKAYCYLYNTYYGWTHAAIDMQDWSFDEMKTLSNLCDARNGLISYNSIDKWYIAYMEDTLRTVAFTKPNSEESLWAIDDTYLISDFYNYDGATGSISQDYCVYDMTNGGICDKKNNQDLSEYNITLCDYNQGIILYETHDEMQATKGLYIWNLCGMTADEPALAYDIIDFHVDENRVEELIQEIYEQYGVNVYYDAENLKKYSVDYNLIECTDIEKIGYMLVKLKECMAEYPEGFFEEIKGERMSNVVYCLCEEHDRTDMDSIDDAAATVCSIEDTLRMTIDVDYWQGLRKLFLHENTHMMENRIEEHMEKISSKNHTEYWYTEMNLPDCPPLQWYIWDRDDEENLKGVYDYDPENACYIDWYSKCTINEDHARIMENGIYTGSAHYYTAPYIDRKSRLLNAMVREAFPCVQNSEEVFWEQRTGIVDLYQEFPDLIVEK